MQTSWTGCGPACLVRAALCAIPPIIACYMARFVNAHLMVHASGITHCVVNWMYIVRSLLVSPSSSHIPGENGNTNITSVFPW